MKKIIRIFALAVLISVCAALPLAAQKTDYQIGESEGGLLNDGKLKDAFQKAVDKFEEWMYEGVPSGYVTRQDDYYIQEYSDKNNQTAAIYVGSDYGSYVLRGPIYEQLDSMGGLKSVGRPVSDPYEVNGTWYQNFENGYATVGKDSGKAVFTQGVHVDRQGGTVPLNVTDNAGGNGSGDSGNGSGNGSGSGDGLLTTDSNSNTTDRNDQTVSSPSQMISDVVSDVEEGASKWGIWVFVILLVLAVAILAIYWFLKKK